MKYTICINQAGMVEYGLSGKIDWIDWAIASLVYDLEQSQKSHRCGDKIWLNYKTIMSEFPTMGIKSKAPLSIRIKKLVSVKLIEKEQADDERLFVKTTELYAKAAFFTVIEQEKPFSKKNSSLTNSNKAVLKKERTVLKKERTVLKKEQSTEYNNSTQEHTIITTEKNDYFELTPEQHECFNLVMVLGIENGDQHWFNQIGGGIGGDKKTFLAIWNNPRRKLKEQFLNGELHAKKYSANVTSINAASGQTNQKNEVNYESRNTKGQYFEGKRRANAALRSTTSSDDVIEAIKRRREARAINSSGSRHIQGDERDISYEVVAEFSR